MINKELRAHVEAAVRRFDPEMAKTATDLRDAMILLASGLLGADEAAIAESLGVPRRCVDRMSARLRLNGVWVGDRLVSDWDTEAGGMAFVLDLGVGQGFMEKDGDRYGLTPAGIKKAEKLLGKRR